MSPQPPSDEFLDRLVAGDRRATTEFADEFTPLLLAFLRGFAQLTGEDREEVTQDTLVAALESLPRYDRTRRFITWLLSIAKYKALDRLRMERQEWVEGEFGQLPTTTSLRDAVEPGSRWKGETIDTQDDRDAARAQRPDSYDLATAGESGDHGDAVELGEAIGAEPSTKVRLDQRSAFLSARLADLKTWLAGLSAEEQVVATHFTHDVDYPAIADKLSELLGKQVTNGSARVRGSRFAKKVRARFGNLL